MEKEKQRRWWNRFTGVTVDQFKAEESGPNLYEIGLHSYRQLFYISITEEIWEKHPKLFAGLDLADLEYEVILLPGFKYEVKEVKKVSNFERHFYVEDFEEDEKKEPKSH